MRLLLLSDIHSNYAALRSVAEQSRPYDEVAFAGDVVDYGPRPAECIAWLRQHAKWAVRGNHDEALGNDTNCRSSLAFRELSIASRGMNRRRVSRQDREYLRTLPLTLKFSFQNTRFGMVHATPAHPLYRYLPDTLPDDELREALEPLASEVDVIVLGHTHRPFVSQLGNVQVVNPGSVGQPKYTAPYASCAIWENGAIALQRVSYPLKETLWDLQNSGLTSSQIEQLGRVLQFGSLDTRP